MGVVHYLVRQKQQNEPADQNLIVAMAVIMMVTDEVITPMTRVAKVPMTGTKPIHLNEFVEK